MARARMMGFKPVDEIPTSATGGRRQSLYAGVVRAAAKGQNYALDTGDPKRAYSLSSTIRSVIKSNGLKGRVRVAVRYATVYVGPVDDGDGGIDVVAER